MKFEGHYDLSRNSHHCQVLGTPTGNSVTSGHKLKLKLKNELFYGQMFLGDLMSMDIYTPFMIKSNFPNI